MKNILNNTCLGLIIAVLFATLFLTAVISIPTSAQTQPGEVAYKSGNSIKFRNVIYTFVAIDDRSDSAIYGWSVYLPAGWACGAQVIVDNPDAEASVALRDTTSLAQNDPSPAIGDCQTVAINVQPPYVEVTTQALCSEAGGTWSTDSCAFNDTPSATPAPTAAAEESSTCEDSGWFSWIQCPLLKASDELITYLDNQIDSLLRTPESYYKNESVDNSWARMRNLAYILLIPILLVMVISTALGFNFVDAYTIKRALPRMLAAIIFIALSLPVLQLLMDINTVFGTGIAGLVLSSVPGAEDISLAGLFDPNGVQAAAIGGAVILTAAAFPIWIGAATFMAISVALSVFTIFALLAFRQLLLVALMIFAPLAILSWIFPGNDKLWKLWSGSFWKLMLLYPLIMGLLAVGRVFAVIIKDSGVTGVIAILLILVAYIGPFFLIPAAFKFAGGVFANIGGMVNNRQRGAFDRLRKGRQNSLNKGFKNARSGDAKVFGKKVGAKYSKVLQGATNVDKAGVNPMSMRSKMRTAMNDGSTRAVADYMKGEEFDPIHGDDAKLWAARHENETDIANELATRDAGRFAGAGNARARADAVQQIKRAQNATSRDTFQRARIQSQATTGTGYQNAQGEFDASLMLDDINRTFGNDRNGAGSAIAQMRGALTQSGQIAGQAGFSEWAGAAERMYNAQTSGLPPAQRLAVARQAHEAIMDNATDSAPPQYAIHGKPSSARAMGASHARKLQQLSADISAGVQVDDGRGGLRTLDKSDMDAALAASAGIYDAMAAASPQNASAFANELMGVQIAGSRTLISNPNTPTDNDLTVRELIQDRDAVGDKEYIDRRRNQYQRTMDTNNPNLPQPPMPNPNAP